MVRIKDEILKEENNLTYDEKHIICSKENEIIRECNEIVTDNYGPNKKETKKKKIELFHLLVLLKKYDIGIEVKRIEPHEPGDFMIIDKYNNLHLVEVFTIFGECEEYKMINDNIGNLFEFKAHEVKEVCGEFSKISKRNLLDKLKEKNSMDFKEKNIKSTILLIVTTESNLCANTGSWIAKYARNETKEITDNKSFDHIYVVDYYASGRDGLEIAFDLIEEINYYISVFRNDQVF